MKRIIRLTESDLHRIVKESVNRILREGKVVNHKPYYYTDNTGREFNGRFKMNRDASTGRYDQPANHITKYHGFMASPRETYNTDWRVAPPGKFANACDDDFSADDSYFAPGTQQEMLDIHNERAKKYDWNGNIEGSPKWEENSLKSDLRDRVNRKIMKMKRQLEKLGYTVS